MAEQRNTIIAELEETGAADSFDHEVICVKTGAVKAALELLKAQEPGWISVKDRMPENELMVIGYTPVDGYMFIGFHKTEVVFGYDWSSWYIITSMRSTKKITKKVTHWMPLPTPPEET